MLRLKNLRWRQERRRIAQVFEDRRFGRGFWRAVRGEWMVNRGDLCGSCVVIFVVEKYANF